MSSGDWTRRRFVAGLALVTASLSTPLPKRRPLRDTGTRGRAAQFVATIAAPYSAARIGAHYLAAVPEERDLESLLRLLGAGDATDRMSTADLRARLRTLQRDDFVHERVAELDGWLLSRTEVRLYALANLLGT